jgi:hypothetical protein
MPPPVPLGSKGSLARRARSLEALILLEAPAFVDHRESPCLVRRPRENGAGGGALEPGQVCGMVAHRASTCKEFVKPGLGRTRSGHYPVAPSNLTRSGKTKRGQ